MRRLSVVVLLLLLPALPQPASGEASGPEVVFRFDNTRGATARLDLSIQDGEGDTVASRTADVPPGRSTQSFHVPAGLYEASVYEPDPVVPNFGLSASGQVDVRECGRAAVWFGVNDFGPGTNDAR